MSDEKLRDEITILSILKLTWVAKLPHLTDWYTKCTCIFSSCAIFWGKVYYWLSPPKLKLNHFLILKQVTADSALIRYRNIIHYYLGSTSFYYGNVLQYTFIGKVYIYSIWKLLALLFFITKMSIEEKIITQVERFPPLYDTSCTQYPNKTIKENCWVQISNNMDISGTALYIIML